MSMFGDSTVLNGDLVDSLFGLPEEIRKLMFPRQVHDNKAIPVDVLDAPKEYILYMDVPGLSKSDIQVTVENENTLVIRSNGKRKREDAEEEGCKYIRLEKKSPKNFMRKFGLHEDANPSAITAKCENGVLTVVVEKLPPPPKPKTVRVTVS